MDLIEELKLLREKKGVSQTAVADAIGCNQGAVSHWERGVAAPSGLARKSLEKFVAKLRKLPDVENAA